jgi:hypothetical protein
VHQQLQKPVCSCSMGHISWGGSMHCNCTWSWRRHTAGGEHTAAPVQDEVRSVADTIAIQMCVYIAISRRLQYKKTLSRARDYIQCRRHRFQAFSLMGYSIAAFVVRDCICWDLRSVHAHKPLMWCGYGRSGNMCSMSRGGKKGTATSN